MKLSTAITLTGFAPAIAAPAFADDMKGMAMSPAIRSALTSRCRASRTR